MLLELLKNNINHISLGNVKMILKIDALLNLFSATLRVVRSLLFYVENVNYIFLSLFIFM